MALGISLNPVVAATFQNSPSKVEEGAGGGPRTLGLLTGSYPTPTPTFPPRLGDRRAGFQCGLDQTVGF